MSIHRKKFLSAATPVMRLLRPDRDRLSQNRSKARPCAALNTSFQIILHPGSTPAASLFHIIKRTIKIRSFSCLYLITTNRAIAAVLPASAVASATIPASPPWAPPAGLLWDPGTANLPWDPGLADLLWGPDLAGLPWDLGTADPPWDLVLADLPWGPDLADLPWGPDRTSLLRNQPGKIVIPKDGLLNFRNTTLFLL